MNVDQYYDARSAVLDLVTRWTSPAMAVRVIALIEDLVATATPEAPIGSTQWLQRASIFMTAAGDSTTEISMGMINHYARYEARREE